jgi:hypothetical protein
MTRLRMPLSLAAVALLLLAMVPLQRSAATAQTATSCVTETRNLVNNNSAVMDAYFDLKPTSDECDEGDENQTTCSFDYTTTRSNSAEYKTACIAQGGQFYRYNASLTNCLRNYETDGTTSEYWMGYPDCVGANCTVEEATEWFYSKYSEGCTANLTIVEGPIVASNVEDTDDHNNSTTSVRPPPTKTPPMASESRSVWGMWDVSCWIFGGILSLVAAIM